MAILQSLRALGLEVWRVGNELKHRPDDLPDALMSLIDDYRDEILAALEREQPPDGTTQGEAKTDVDSKKLATPATPATHPHAVEPANPVIQAGIPPTVDAVVALWRRVGSPFLKHPGPPRLELGQGDALAWRAFLEGEAQGGGAGVELIYAALQRRAAIYEPGMTDCLLCGGGGVYSPLTTKRNPCAHCAEVEAAIGRELRDASCIICKRGGVLLGIRAPDGGLVYVCAECRREHTQSMKSSRRK